MKTVPSGRFDCCIYGALAVGGTEATGILYVVAAAPSLAAGNEGRLAELVLKEGKSSVLAVLVDRAGRLPSDDPVLPAVAAVVPLAAVGAVVAAAVFVFVFVF
jgi:hypothetical protein